MNDCTPPQGMHCAPGVRKFIREHWSNADFHRFMKEGFTVEEFTKLDDHYTAQIVEAKYG